MNQAGLCRIVLVCVVTMMIWATDAAAGTIPILPNPTGSSGCINPIQGEVIGTPDCTESDANGQVGMTVSFLPFAGLSGSASVAAGTEDSFTGTATVGYSFEALGGNPGDQVPLQIFTNLFTSISNTGGDGLGFSEILIYTNNGNTFLGNRVACTQQNNDCAGSPPGEFSGSFGVTVSSGAVDQLVLEIEVGAGNNGPNGESASAIADPMITIDPNFAGAANYSLVFSPGVGNEVGPGIPEPGTLTLICCGGALLLLRRRNQRVSS
jgi:hypothetical protein